MNESITITREAARLLSQRRYFTGLPCKRGHIAPRLVSTSHCIECKRRRDKAAAAKWVKKNPEKDRARKRKWAKRNPEILKCNKRKRRAMKLNCEGSHKHQDILDLLILQKSRCAACSKSIKGGFHIDHIVPLTKGGTDWPHNLQLLCAFCNVSKHNNDPIQWQQKRGFLL